MCMCRSTITRVVQLCVSPAGSKDFQCDICMASFTTNGSLVRHMVVHTTQKSFKCPHCDETFTTSVLARKHIKSHTVQGTSCSQKLLDHYVSLADK